VGAVQVALEAPHDPGIDAREHGERRVVQVHDVGRIAEPAHPHPKRAGKTVVLVEQFYADT